MSRVCHIRLVIPWLFFRCHGVMIGLPHVIHETALWCDVWCLSLKYTDSKIPIEEKKVLLSGGATRRRSRTFYCDVHSPTGYMIYVYIYIYIYTLQDTYVYIYTLCTKWYIPSAIGREEAKKGKALTLLATFCHCSCVQLYGFLQHGPLPLLGSS